MGGGDLNPSPPLGKGGGRERSQFDYGNLLNIIIAICKQVVKKACPGSDSNRYLKLSRLPSCPLDDRGTLK